MKRGTKPKPASELVATGTFQKIRHGDRVEIVVAGDPPIMPEYLGTIPGAIDVWQEEIGRVMQAGATEADSSFFARYCATEAAARKAFAGGEMVPAAFLSELRKMAEMLRIAGGPSRVGVKSDSTKPTNPFAKLR